MVTTLAKVDKKNAGKFPQYTEEELKIISQFFDGSRLKTEKIRQIIKERFGVERTYFSVRHKAAQIGMTRGKNNIRWTNAQEEELASLLSNYTVRQIAKKLGRSLRSIHQKCNELRLSTRQRSDWYVMTEVCEIFGVVDDTVMRWINSNKLKASHFGDNMWKIEKEQLKKFIRRYPSEINGRSTDIMQLVEILCGIEYT